jgi:tRNA(His) guanylyltransferase
MSNKLKNRIEGYQHDSNHRLLPRVPLIISVNGRGFSKITSLLDKPYCEKFGECILSTMMRLCTDIDGALFGYQHNDEIVLVVRNDQTQDTLPWYDNSVQKICSVVSSLSTSHFAKCAGAVNLDFMSDPLFISQVFVVPNIAEAINTMVFKQQHNFHTSIQFACFYELLKKYDKNTIKEMLSGLSIDERIDLLHQECGIDFNDYPDHFRRGAACYKVPKIMEGGNIKNKWIINSSLPIFTKDQTFLSNIFKNGADIFRQESL